MPDAQTDTGVQNGLASSFFVSAGLAGQIVRALSLQDRSRHASTYGSFDRQFWYYRTLVGFPGASWQQLAFALVTLAFSEFAVAHRKVLIEASKAGLLYWTKIQHSDGSFDEWYRNERSYCATAFTLGGMMETALLLRNHLDDREHDTVLQTGIRAGDWLASRFNPLVANQNLAATWGLFALAKATGENRFREAAHKKLDLTFKQQNAEGWFSEYGGMDLGYSTLALDLLALASRHDPLPKLREAAKSLSDLLWSVAAGHPLLPTKLGSRGTGHVFPYGAFFFADKVPSAAALSRLWAAGLEDGILTLPAQVDDRYFAYFYFPHFSLAAVEAAKSKQSVAPLPPSAKMTFLPEGGFQILRRGDMHLHISTHLGGAIAMLRRGHGPQYLLGYTLCLRDGSAAVTNYWSTTRDEKQGEHHIGLISVFSRQHLRQPLTKLDVPFTLLTHMLANAWVSGYLQRLLKAKLLMPLRQIDASLQRDITWDDNEATVVDHIALGAIGDVVLRLSEEVVMHSPSARLFQTGQGQVVDEFEVLSAGINLTADQREVEICYRIRFSPEGRIELVDFKVEGRPV